jgi:hypothetical protein
MTAGQTTVQQNRQQVPVQPTTPQNGQNVQPQSNAKRAGQIIGSRFQGQGTDGYTPQTTQTGIVDPSRPVQNNVNPDLYKDGIIFLGKGKKGEDALYIRKDPGDILRTMIRLNDQGRGGELTAQIKKVGVELSRDIIPKPIYTINSDGSTSNDSGAVTESGGLANSSMGDWIASGSGADGSSGGSGIAGLISALELVGLDPNSKEFDSSAGELLGSNNEEVSGLKRFAQSNPGFVEGATTVTKALVLLKEKQASSVERGKALRTVITADLKKLNTPTATAAGQ